MKIDLIIPSRGQALRLMSVITAFDNLATGEHDITYNVVCDLDDPLTWKALKQLPGVQVAVHAGAGPLAERMNTVAMECDADTVSGAADDTFPLAQHWDDIIAAGKDQGHDLFSWQEVNDPTNHTMIVFSRRWLKAVGRMLPTYFPFWFGDTWVAEVYELAFNRPLPIVENLQWGGKRGKTNGMRDLAFWFEFFSATRVERIAEARSVCYAFARPFVANQAMIEDMERRDREQLARVPHYEEYFGANKGEPSEQYTTMKTAADTWLQNHKEKAA